MKKKDDQTETVTFLAKDEKFYFYLFFIKYYACSKERGGHDYTRCTRFNNILCVMIDKL